MYSAKCQKIIVLLFITFSSVVIAQTKLPSFFSDNMVLQRNESVAIWGYDNSGVQVTVSGSWGNEASIKSDKEGAWKLKLQTPEAGGPYTISIRGSKELELNNVLIGEVWLCSGQSNMNMPLKGYTNSGINGNNEAILNAKNDQIRFFNTEIKASLEPLKDVSGQWLEAEPSTVVDFSALAYYFGVKLHSVLNVPIGLIHTSWGGSSVEAWMDEQTLSQFEEIEIADQIPEKGANRSPSLLYNGMLSPFVPYGLRGFIWYQGESNVNRAGEYRKLFSTMIGSWREKWQQDDMPFYFVQIAPFGYGKNSALLREAQMQTMQTVDNTGMAVTLDIGDCNDIHPSEKKIIGDRLAYWALVNDYGVKGVSCGSPVYKSMENDSEGKLKVTFDYNQNGLTTFGKNLNGFEVAGTDKVFHAAQAKINGDKTVSVWSEMVEKPVAVRYAFDNCTEASLFNTEGLPASSFRTDDWDD